MAFDFKKEYKEFYMPKDKPAIILEVTLEVTQSLLTDILRYISGIRSGGEKNLASWIRL